jgi:hypothetical protein
MEATDVEFWRGCNLPVIIVLVHLETREAYWQSVDTGGGPSSRRTARDTIADLCVAKSGFGVWFPPLKSGESGHLNSPEHGGLLP